MGHPAPYHLNILAEFDRILSWRFRERHNKIRILDPMAGTGRIHLLDHWHEEGDNPPRVISAVDIEEWPDQEGPVRIADSTNPKLWNPGQFDAICVSPVYPNRMTDHHNAKDDSVRHSYTHDLGMPLEANNTGRMPWGEEHRRVTTEIWRNCNLWLPVGGLFLLNIKDNLYTKKKVKWRRRATDWHIVTLLWCGFTLLEITDVPLKGMRFGANPERVPFEHVITFGKVAEPGLGSVPALEDARIRDV